MSSDKTRRQIAYEAARLMYVRQESEYYRAKMKAARQVVGGWVKPADLPTNREIRDEILSWARMYEGDRRTDSLREMRIEALRMMKALAAFRPRLIGSTLTGHVRQGSDIDIHVFCDSLAAVTGALDYEGGVYDVEHKRVRKHGEERVFTHIHVQGRFTIEITLYAERLASFPFKSSITGKTIERAGIDELEDLLLSEYPDLVLDDEFAAAENKLDRFQVYEMLLLPLERVKQNPKWHPEGDVLYHSLQVFDLARDELAYDEEFLLAALLHDVGKGIDPRDHVAAGLEALEGYISERTHWLIEHHVEAGALRDNSLGARSKRRLQAHESFAELEILAKCDRQGRVAGVEAPELNEALDYLRDLARMCG